jgi:hypothetical protein
MNDHKNVGFDWLTHPMIPSASFARIRAMDENECRLLDNVRKAIATCDIDESTIRREDTCVEALLKGVDAASKLRIHLTGGISPGNRKAFTDFLELAIPAAKDSSATFSLYDRRKQKPVTVSVSDAIYEVRCLSLHENDNLDESEGVRHMIRLRWNVYSEKFICLSEQGDYIVINALLLMRRLREILSLFVTSIDSIMNASEKGQVSFSICPEKGSIQPVRHGHKRK